MQIEVRENDNRLQQISRYYEFLNCFFSVFLLCYLRAFGEILSCTSVLTMKKKKTEFVLVELECVSISRLCGIDMRQI